MLLEYRYITVQLILHYRPRRHYSWWPFHQNMNT